MSSLDDVLLGMRLAFEGYRIPKIPYEVAAGVRVAISGYPPVRLYRWLRDVWTETKIAVGKEVNQELKFRGEQLFNEYMDILRPSTVELDQRYYVRMIGGAKIQFADRDAAIKYANSERVRGKCWVEDGSPITKEHVLFVVTRNGTEQIYHASPHQDRILLDTVLIALCGCTGRVVRIERDEWFSGNRYCARCFPKKSDLRRYVTEHSLVWS